MAAPRKESEVTSTEWSEVFILIKYEADRGRGKNEVGAPLLVRLMDEASAFRIVARKPGCVPRIHCTNSAIPGWLRSFVSVLYSALQPFHAEELVNLRGQERHKPITERK